MGLKIIECTGASKKEAFKDLPYNPDCSYIRGVNVKKAWKKAGSPSPGTTNFKTFMATQVYNVTKNTPGLGVFLEIDKCVMNTRTKPYTVFNYKKVGSSKWVAGYIIREDNVVISDYNVRERDELGRSVITDTIQEAIITKTGPMIEFCMFKKDALNRIKELSKVTQKSYSLIPVKYEPGLKPAATCVYTTSKSAKQGTWITAGFPEDD